MKNYAKKEVDPINIGNKAFNLERLIRCGFPVPSMFVLPIGYSKKEFDDLKDWLRFDKSNPDIKRNLAIRSSSVDEDTKTESMAGHFESVIGEFDFPGVVEAIERVKQSGPNVAVIVQNLVDAKYAGVLFSCDPMTYERNRSTIEWTEGLADKLLEGLTLGHMLQTDYLGQIISGDWPSNAKTLQELNNAAKMLEKEFCSPVDIEWAIDHHHSLWFLQVRPIVLPQSKAIHLTDPSSFEMLPSIIKGHHKIRLRQKAVDLGVLMAPAIVETSTGTFSDRESLPSDAAAASVVLLHPEHINCAIVREFAPTSGIGVKTWTERCRRYAIRRYPKVEDVPAAKLSVLNAGLSQSWASAAIIQTIWDAPITGIIRRTNDCYIIDVAQGHFVPKGVVEVSTIIISHARKIISENWCEQSISYHFVDGHVITESPLDHQIRLSEGQLLDIVDSLDPLFDNYQDAALEFGLLETDGNFSVYLIDVAESDSETISLDHEMISSGVISSGKSKGRIRRVSTFSENALDRHLHDKGTGRTSSNNPVIVVAEFPSTELLPYLCDDGVVGFVFKQSSVLAHLPVVLREKGIPAIAISDTELFDSLKSGVMIELDAISRELKSRDRVRFLDVSL